MIEHSARVMWRAFPYFGWRYGERGRAFGRSDAGYLATLAQLEEEAAHQQVSWLAKVLMPRGMPSLLLEYQLESLGRAAVRRRRPSAQRMLLLAARLRAARLGVLAAGVAAQCERLCWAAAQRDPVRRGAGGLIAAAVVDRALGLGTHDEALVAWLSSAAPTDLAWGRACVAARALALASLLPSDRAP